MSPWRSLVGSDALEGLLVASSGLLTAIAGVVTAWTGFRRALPSRRKKQRPSSRSRSD